MQTIKLPPELQLPEYFGTVKWTVRAIFQYYTGWFDEKTSSFFKLSPSSINFELIELAGGVEKMTAKAKELLNKKEYTKVLHLTEIILEQQPGFRPAIEVRLETLKALRALPYNSFERTWIINEINQLENK